MKYIHQSCYILLFTFLGEALSRLIPLPVPAAIWGLILMFAALCTGLLKEEQIRESAHWMVSILPVLFVAPTVDLMDSFGLLLPHLAAVLALLPVCTLLTFFSAGKTTQLLLKNTEAKRRDE